MQRIKLQVRPDHPAWAVRVSQHESAARIVAALELPKPRAVVVLNGGTAQLDPELHQKLKLVLGNGLARTAAEDGISLVTGGTTAGIFALLGEGIGQWGLQAPCIGVVVAKYIAWNAQEQGEVMPEPHHSHFVCVDGQAWGDETTMMYELMRYLAQDCPSVAVFASGGIITLREMAANVQQQRPMILLAHSGRSTDRILSMRSGSEPLDPELQAIAEYDKIHQFDLNQPAAEFATLLRSVLQLPTP